MADERVRALERVAADDPGAWRALVAELRRAGRLGEARAVANKAWQAARDRCDAAHAKWQGSARKEHLDTMDACLADMDEANELSRVLLHELHHEDGPGRCYCEASALPHEKHLGKRRRRTA